MISPPAMDDLLSYLLLGGGALIIFGLLSLFKDQVEKRQRAHRACGRPRQPREESRACPPGGVLETVRGGRALPQSRLDHHH